MPIKGFKQRDYTEQDIINIYGRRLSYGKFGISSRDFIPYVCDYTGEEFKIGWPSLKKHLLAKRNSMKYSWISEIQSLCDIIVEQYNKGRCLYSLSKEFGFAEQSISKMLKENGVCPRKKAVIEYNTDFFSKIEKPEKAQILGFIYADGYLQENYRDLVIRLSRIDREYLEKLKEWFEFTGQIKDMDYSCAASQLRIKLTQKSFEDIQKLGIFQKKSFLITFPTESQVPQKLLKYFLLGYFEGDGCLGKTKKGGTFWSFMSTLDMCEKSKHFIYDETDVKTRIQTRKTSKGNLVYNLCCSKHYDVIKIMEWMYDGTTLKMQRKYDKFITSFKDGHQPKIYNYPIKPDESPRKTR